MQAIFVEIHTKRVLNLILEHIRVRVRIILSEQTRCNSIYFVVDRLNKPIRDFGGLSIYRIQRYNTTDYVS